jgi:fumarate hydratase subunit alpha
MREIKASAVAAAVASLFRQANCELGEDVLEALRKARRGEVSEAGREVLDTIIANAAVAAAEKMPLCQDCGLAVVFIEMGQEVHITGGNLYNAVDEGVRRAYGEGYLRKSTAARPFSGRANTGDNTPAVIHVDIVPGDGLKIAAMPKGGGAENMSRLGMLLPEAGPEGVAGFVAMVVDEAGSKPCPPVILGVGIGGTAEKAMLLAKKALLRKVGGPSLDAETAALEREILRRVNNLGIGPAGYGGRITALAVHVETFPAHIASLPVAVNLQCHSARKREVIL